MRFRGLDLNLLVALSHLAETRSVSAAARRLNLSQPAMSSALRRLRQHFEDELLVVIGRRMYPTDLLRRLTPQLDSCLRDIDGLVMATSTFDPTTTRRTFRIVASDYVSVVLIAPLARRLATEAPGIQLQMFQPDEDIFAEFAEGGFDLLISPDPFTQPDHPAECLFEDRYVLAGWNGNPMLERPITEAEFLDSSHVATGFGSRGGSGFADRQLALMGKSRRIDVVVPSFTAVPWLLLGTQRLAMMHARLVEELAKTLPIASGPLPFEFPAMRLMIQHHLSQRDDGALRWLREALANEASQ